MADNYLERKMEELRSGRLSQGLSQRASAPRRNGMLQVPFPPKRVLVVGASECMGAVLCRKFHGVGCKVALFDADRETGERLAHDAGIRFYPVDIDDEKDMEMAFGNLMAAWRDIDIIISAAEKVPLRLIANLWAAHRRKFPIPTEYGGRLITISSSSKENELLSETLYGFGITVNNININGSSTLDKIIEENGKTSLDELQATAARLCLFLSLPSNRLINGTDITLPHRHY